MFFSGEQCEVSENDTLPTEVHSVVAGNAPLGLWAFTQDKIQNGLIEAIEIWKVIADWTNEIVLSVSIN